MLVSEPAGFHARLAALASISLSEAFHINVIWSMAPFMLQDLGIGEADIGGWVGVLSASFFAAQLVASPAWGALADHYGRRPTLLIGVLGAAGSIVLLGLNASMASNVSARALAGLLNGNIGITKTYLSEIVDDTNRARGFSVLAFTWGVGCIVAPALGGFLSSPAVKYPSVFDTSSLFGKYPYMLPSLAVSSVSLLGFIYGWFFLPETEPFLARKEQREEVAHTRLRSTSSPEDLAPEPDKLECNVPEVSEHPDIDPKLEEKARDTCCNVAGKFRGTRLQWLWNAPHAIRLVVIYSLLASHAIVFEELWSVLLKAPSVDSGHGSSSVGLGFSTDQVGISLMIGGALLLPFQLFIFPGISEQFGSWQVLNTVTPFLIVLYLGFPGIAFIRSSTGVWIAICFAQLIKVVCYASGFTSLIMMIGQACEGPHLGFANGMSQALSSGARMVAPLAGGWVWSSSLASRFPMRQWIVYLLISLIVVISCLVSYQLPRQSFNVAHVQPSKEDIDQQETMRHDEDDQVEADEEEPLKHDNDEEITTMITIPLKV